MADNDLFDEMVMFRERCEKLEADNDVLRKEVECLRSKESEGE